MIVQGDKRLGENDETLQHEHVEAKEKDLPVGNSLRGVIQVSRVINGYVMFVTSNILQHDALAMMSNVQGAFQ